MLKFARSNARELLLTKKWLLAVLRCHFLRRKACQRGCGAICAKEFSHSIAAELFTLKNLVAAWLGWYFITKMGWQRGWGGVLWFLLWKTCSFGDFLCCLKQQNKASRLQASKSIIYATPKGSKALFAI
jgi:hypothetical protein